MIYSEKRLRVKNHLQAAQWDALSMFQNADSMVENIVYLSMSGDCIKETDRELLKDRITATMAKIAEASMHLKDL